MHRGQELTRNDAVADLRVDGRYGPETAAAVRQYQLGARLPGSGVVDIATWKQLRADACL